MKYTFQQKQKNNSRYRKELLNNPTKEELIFKKYLESLGLKFNFQKGFLKPFHRIVDFYIKKYRLIIEIDGGYHLNTLDKDALKDKIWNRFRTLRITNSQINDGSYESIFKEYIKNS